MKPTGPIPPHFSASDDGQLLIGGYAVEELVAEAGGTPLFVYDNNIIGGQIAALTGRDAGRLGDYIIPSRQTLTSRCSISLDRYVDGFRVVSRGELERLKRAELAGIPMTFAGPGKRDDELEAGIAAGATISVESEGEARRAIHAGERVGIQPKLAVRVNPPFAIERRQDHHGRPAEPVRRRCRARARAGPGPARSRRRLARPAHLRRRRNASTMTALIEAHKAIIACAGDIAERARPAAARAQPWRRVRRALLRRRAAARHLPHGERAARDLVRRAGAARDDALSLELGRWLVGEAGVYLTRVSTARRAAARPS